MKLTKLRSLVFLICALCISSGAFAADPENSGLVRFGLFVGSNDGGGERVTLAYANRDAKSMAEVLTEMGGIRRANSLVLEDPGRSELNDSFQELRDLIADAKSDARRVEVVVYYSGHSDEQGLLLGSDHYGYRELRDNIISMDSDVNIAILDSCSSGAFTRLKGGTRQSPFLLDESVNTKGHAFLTSSSEDEAAQESDSIGGSFFTHYLVSALRGAADSTRDGIVTLNEAYTYAFSETLSRTTSTLAGPQHASHEISLTGSGELILTDLRVSSAGITLGNDVRGQMFIKDRSGRMVAEVRKEAGIPLTLAVPSGRYTVTLVDGDTLYSTSLSVAGANKAAVGMNQFTPIAAEVTTSRGSDVLVVEDPSPHDITSVAELTSGIIDDLVHIGSLLNFFPKVPSAGDRTVVDRFSLKLVGSAYRIEGVDLGLLNMVTEDVRGTQVAAVGNIVGNDVAGAQLGGVFSLTGGEVRGAQASGVFNITDGDVRGGQAAGVFNIASGEVRWFQGAGVFNIAHGSQMGFQGAGVFNILDGDVYGMQGAGVFNIAERSVSGFQGAGVVNVAGGAVNGFQGAGVVNVADGVNGVQAAGVVNAARRINGAQIGLINVGGTANGLQLGLINLSENLNGFALGLLNISGNGLHDPSVWSDDTGFTYTGLQFGAGAFYTLLYAGGPYENPASGLTLGLGMGVHADFSPFFVDVDVSAKSMGSGADLGAAIQDSAGDFYTSDLEALASPYQTDLSPSVRATVGFTLFRRVSLLAGVSIEGYVPGFSPKSEYFHAGEPWVLTSNALSGATVELYPRWYAGIRL
jgi:hypothetical protein